MLKRIAILVVLLVLLSTQITFAQTVPFECRGLPVLSTSSIIQDRSDLSYLYDGFCLEQGDRYLRYDGYPSSRFLAMFGPAYYVTDAHYYSNGLMDDKLLELGIDLESIGAEDGIALQTCPLALEQGQVLIRFPGMDQWITVVVIDCVSPEHQEFRQSEYTSAIDMTFRLAEKYGFTDSGGVLGVVVCTDLDTPEITCAGEPESFYQWFWANLSYAG